METKNEKHYAEYCRVRNQVRAVTRKLKKNQYELKLAKDAKSTQRQSGSISTQKLRYVNVCQTSILTPRIIIQE